MSGQWRETYEGGSAAAERLAFEALARDVLHLQLRTKTGSRAAVLARALHAKPLLAVEDAELRFSDELPDDLRAGFAQPGAAYRTAVRFSNAHGAPRPDPVADGRGLALRVHVSDSEQHDLLLANAPASYARDARQYVAFAAANAGGPLRRLAGLARMAWTLGPRETRRMVVAARGGRRRRIASLAQETFWSGGAIRWGETLAVRYLLRPMAAAPTVEDSGDLGREIAARLAAGDVKFELCVQRYVDEASTPIEDGAAAWPEAVSPPVPVAVLTIGARGLGGERARESRERVEALAFNPWNTTDAFRPLGNLNRARKAVYDASAAHRLGFRWVAEIPLRNRIFGGLARLAFTVVNRRVEWHRLPLRLGLLNVDMLRHTLRRRSLIDTERREAPPAARPVPPPIPEAARRARTADGSYTDLSDPRMGAVGATFGRNMPPVWRPDLFDEPNPVTVSDVLLARRTFLPATSLNVLAAAWIQFQVHDWVSHARYPLGHRDVIVPLPPGRVWQNTPDGPDEGAMRIAGEVGAHEDDAAGPPIVFANGVSHWWDGSEVYGASAADADRLRDRVNGAASATLRLENGYLPEDVNGVEVTGFNNSWWLGLSAMHTLFAREHNALCEALRSEHRDWSDERLYQTARLIVSALIAKIHTVEWTPAILATESLRIAMSANWYGPRPEDWVTRLGLWLVDSHALEGIPKTMPDHHAAPYSLTEDFAAVYRLHPLIPDEYRLLDHVDGALIDEIGFTAIQGRETDEVMRRVGLPNALYSFGIAHPGAITLHNFPQSLRKFERDGQLIDLAVVDIVRDRRRGVPRYNDFRAGLHRSRVARWEDLTADAESVRLLKEVYHGDIDMVDTMVGLHAEPPPAGFGFSDTAFRIFLLMASRRLQSDRFLTVDFRPEVYSPLGMDWIERNDMTSVILRHAPELKRFLPETGSAFAPWRAAAASA